MGYLTILGNTPSDACALCAVVHEPEQPHDLQSLAYQYKFYDQYGRWPTWADAMAHCSNEIKACWMEALTEMSIEVDPQQGVELELEIRIKVGKEAEAE